jgi:BirA family biotin operon repressor/biotin-[acetyl-CoA-carboxylase] ligase
VAVPTWGLGQQAPRQEGALTAPADSLVADAVVPRLAPGDLGTAAWVHLERTESTNSEAAHRAAQGAPEGTVVVAEEQTAGRGRRGRSFASPAGRGIYLSVVLRPDMPPAHAFRLTFCGALAVGDACAEVGVAARVKWPNDVLVSGRKVCGILAELSTTGDQVGHVVLGIGLNVNSVADDLPPDVRAVATSLRLALGRPLDRPALCARVLAGLGLWYGRTLSDFPSVLAEVRSRCDMLGRTVKVTDGDRVLCGEAVGIDDEGALLLRTPGGLTHVVTGDVVPV